MTEFWRAIHEQVEALKSARSADDVVRILQPPSSGDAFFGGSGGDESVYGALVEAGWSTVWYKAHYHYAMRAPNGDVITYVEGDIYRRLNTAARLEQA